MLLSDIIKHPSTSLQHLERYVNDGSPSGFSKINTTSKETSPFEISHPHWFNAYFCIAPKECFKQFGFIPSYPADEFTNDDNWIMLHPDMAAKLATINKEIKIYKSEKIRVVPTASGRTVQIINQEKQGYIKLHYEGILGRVRRELPYQKAIAGPELSKIIIEAIDKKVIDKKLTLLPETGARVFIIHGQGNIFEWGMVWRENIPYAIEADAMKYLFPAFSLFSSDSMAIYHYPILKQIIDFTASNPEQYVFDVILIPLIKSYFDMIQKLGLQPEWNSQNLLISFNGNFTEARFIMRDLESIDKDLTLMDNLNIKHNFECSPYKCIDETQYNYNIKHSFMFDFKLGECIIDPLLLLLDRHYGTPLADSRNKVKKITKKYINNLPDNFFPKNKWFVFDKVLVDQSVSERPYIEIDNPKFR